MRKFINLRVFIQVIFFVFMIFSFTILERSKSRLLILFLTFFIGSYYCGWICPFGTIQEYIIKIRKKIIKKNYKVPEKIDNLLSLMRYIPLFLGVILITDTLNARKVMFTLLRRKEVSFFSLVILFIFLLLSFFIDRPFCKWFCVDGGRYGIFSFGRFFTIKRNNVKCINCKKCDMTCPMNIKISKCDEVINPKCIDCLSCISSCPEKKTLTIGIREFSSKYSFILFYVALAFGIWIFIKLL